MLYIATPANNHCGHGFYQFSPELFFSLLSPKNGFEILDMSYVEVNRKNGKLKRIRHLKDNTVERQRVEINTRWQTELFLVARRIGSLPKYIDVQQSDYLKAWESGIVSVNSSHMSQIKRKLLGCRCIYWINRLRHSLKKHFQKVEGQYSLDGKLQGK